MIDSHSIKGAQKRGASLEPAGLRCGQEDHGRSLPPSDARSYLTKALDCRSTFAWLSRCRNTRFRAVRQDRCRAFIRLAMIRIMLKLLVASPSS